MDYKQWRVMVVQDDSLFMHDHLKLYIGHRDNEGMHALKPLIFEEAIIDVPADGGTIMDIPFTLLPTGLAEEVYRMLGMYLLKTDDPLKEITQLRARLERVTKQLESLIAGIGRLGGTREEG